MRELAEETGCRPVGPPTAFALLFDEATRCWELIHRVEVESEDLAPQTDEYSELRWCLKEDLPAPRSHAAESMRALLEV